MRFEWSPSLGPLNGAFVFLSASVPDPRRNQRFLKGPVEERLMLRIIDRRVDGAVQSLVAQTLQAGGRIVHGGHPRILDALAQQAGQWKVPAGVEPPIHIYQSQLYADLPPPPGRQQLEKAHTGVVKWVPIDPSQVAAKWHLPANRIPLWLPAQAEEGARPEKAPALLAMRLEMLLETQPVTAVCIGGMEGIEAEAHLYLELAKMGLLPPAEQVHALASTYGASANLEGREIQMADHAYFQAQGPPTHARSSPETFMMMTEASPRPVTPQLRPPSEETAKHDFPQRVSYDGVMRSLVAQIGRRVNE